MATELIQRIGGLPAEDLKDIPRFYTALVYGHTGHGKTYLAASACEVPEMCPILYIDIEGGWDTIVTNFPDAVARGVFTLVKPKDKYANGVIVDYKWQQIERVMNDLKEQSSRGVLRYNTLIIDSLSEAYDLAMEWWLATQYKADNRRDPDLPGAAGGQDDFGRDWNKARSVIRRMTRGFRDVGTHIIFTAHEEERKSRTSNVMTNIPAFPGKVATDLPGFFNEVQYIYVRDSGKREEGTNRPIFTHSLQCQATTTRPACKSRGNLPMVVNDPSMSSLLRLTGISKEAE